jgi:hypothetical protein
MIAAQKPLTTTIYSVGIRPNSSILTVLSHLNYKAWFAVAEFVDNSIQSYNANKERLQNLHGENFKLKIRISLDQKNSIIEITDNAAGIKGEDFPRAFRAAEIPTDRTGLAEFGMGMKTAACWFTHTWTVRSKAVDELVERTINFNLSDILAAKLEELPVQETPSGAEHHYTVLRLENLGKKFPVKRTQKKLRDHLTSIYRCYLRSSEVELYFDDDKISLKYEDPEILFAPNYSTPNSLPLKWIKNIDFEFSSGRRVTGFAALRQEGSTTHAGFSLFRRNRLIVGSYDEAYRPQEIFGNTNSYRYQRLFGELHVEGFNVSHTKDGFHWDDFEEEFLTRLRDHLRDDSLDLLKQADNYRTRPSKSALQPILKKAVTSLSENMQESGSHALTVKGAALGVASAKSGILPMADLIASESNFDILVDGLVWKVTVRASVDPSITEWVRVAKISHQQLGHLPINDLTIDISMAHPFVQQFIGPKNENAELFLRFAVALALATEKSNQSGYPTKLVMHWFNKVIRECLPRNQK